MKIIIYKNGGRATAFLQCNFSFFQFFQHHISTEYEELLHFFFCWSLWKFCLLRRMIPSIKYQLVPVSPVTVTFLSLVSTCFPSSSSCVSHGFSRFQCKQTENGWSLLSELKEALCVLFSVQLTEIQRRNLVTQKKSRTSWAMTPGASFHIKVSRMESVWYRNWKVWSCKQAVKLKWEHTSLFYT